MTRYAPSYYPDFHCIAGACRHSCCIGWEIDIDPKTAAAYRAEPGSLGDRLRAHMQTEDGTVSFILDEKERCPFLNRGGLCDIILEKGEGALCQICRDHPRFRSVFADREEIGLGLCCETAADLILSATEPFSLIALDGDEPAGTPDPREVYLRRFRDRILSAAVNRQMPFFHRLSLIESAAEAPILRLRPVECLRLLRPLERLDSVWDEYLDRLSELNGAGHTGLFPPAWTIPAEQLLAYFLYRYVADPDDETYAPATRVGFALLCTHLILTIALCQPAPAAVTDRPLALLREIAFRFSSEIEYSEDNTATLMACVETWQRQIAAGRGTR